MSSAIKEIQKAFQDAGLKHDVQQMGNNSILMTGMTGKADMYTFFLVKEGDVGNDVALRVMKVCQCSSSQYDQVREVLNELQMKYRFIRFSIDKDGGINAEYDFPTTYEDIGKGAVEMCLRMTMTLDDCISRLKQFA